MDEWTEINSWDTVGVKLTDLAETSKELILSPKMAHLTHFGHYKDFL